MKKVLAILSMTILVASCASISNTSNIGTISGKNPDSIVVATAADWPTMESVSDSGSLVGFDIDLLAEIARRTKIRIELRQVQWGSIFSGLGNGEYDAIASAVPITPKLREEFQFSIPYLRGGQAIVSRSKDSGPSKLDELNGLSVSVLSGDNTESLNFVKSNADANFVGFDNPSQVLGALLDGSVDAAIINLLSYYVDVEETEFRGKVTLSSGPISDEAYGLVFGKGAIMYLERVNLAISSMVEDGEIVRLIDKWHLVAAAPNI